MIIQPGAAGLDYSGARPDVDMMARMGVKFVCRYVTITWKATTRAEIDRLHARRIAVVLNYEKSEGTMLGGAGAGAIAGIEAVAAARRLGAPAGTCIVYSHDTGTWTTKVTQAFQAAYDLTIAAGFTFGVYGGTKSVQGCMNAGMDLKIIWAPMASSWGKHPLAHIWQGHTNIGGIPDTDPNLCLRPFDAWLPGGDVPPPPVDDPPVVVPVPVPWDPVLFNLRRRRMVDA